MARRRVPRPHELRLHLRTGPIRLSPSSAGRPPRRRSATSATSRSARLVVRPALVYGLMAAGECGVERVADILEPEFLRTVRLLGARNVAELGPDRVRGPATEP
jgi:FMN-dependent dehydrogenase